MIVVASSQDKRIDGGIFEFTNDSFYVIEVYTSSLCSNIPYSYDYLKSIFGDFTYKELLFD